MKNIIITIICLVLAVTNYAQIETIPYFFSCDECHAHTLSFQEEYNYQHPAPPAMDANKYYSGVLSRWDNTPTERRVLKGYFQWFSDSTQVTETWIYIDVDFVTMIHHELGSSTVSYLFERWENSFTEIATPVEEPVQYTNWNFGIGKNLLLNITRMSESSTITVDVCCEETTRLHFSTPLYLFTTFNDPKESFNK